MTSSRSRWAAAAFASLAAGIVLSACSVSTSSDAGATDAGSAPAAGPPGPVEPYAAISLTCDAVIPPELLGALFSPAITAAGDVQLRRDAGSPPDGTPEIRDRHAGALRCVWGGAERTGSDYLVGLEFTALPRAVEDADIPDPNEQPDSVDTIGDRSAVRCSLGLCSFDVAVGDVWIHGSFSSGTNDGLSDDVIRERLTSALRLLADAIRSAPRTAPWRAPFDATTVWKGECEDGDSIVASLREAAGDLPVVGVLEDVSAFEAAVASRSTRSSCAVGAGDARASVEFLVGGAWAVDELRGGSSTAGGLPVEPLELSDGTLAAGAVAAESETVWAAVGDGLAVITVSGAGDDPVRAVQVILDGVREASR